MNLMIFSGTPYPTSLLAQA